MNITLASLYLLAQTLAVLVYSVMFKDIPHDGRLYRLIAEKANLTHPEGAVVAIFEVKTTELEKVFELTGDDSELDKLVKQAEENLWFV